MSCRNTRTVVLVMLLFCGMNQAGPLFRFNCLDFVAESGGKLVVYLVRHAEKTAVPTADPPLTARGQARAQALPRIIPLATLVAVYSTPLRRTLDTVRPTAKAAGVAITEYPAADSAGLVQVIRGHAGGAVLVAGHSNTVPEILGLLGIEKRIVIDDDEYGDLFIVTLPDQGKPWLQRSRFGNDSGG